MIMNKLDKLREVITENLRVQQGEIVDYINIGNALQDAGTKQNHAIFARRGCGKTLLLHQSAKSLKPQLKAIYLNCEDFKRHSFPNVLIVILKATFRELNKNLTGWFGRKKRSKEIILEILNKLEQLEKEADQQEQAIKKTNSTETSSKAGAGVGADIESININLSAEDEIKEKEEIERTFTMNRSKLEKLDMWLPELKQNIRDFFELSSSIKGIILQLDDLYHLKRADQAFVVDYIHRLCKDIPLFFKIATLRHASTLYVDRDGQPIGAQERHDYQPINIDYTFADFKKTADQNKLILEQFGKKVGMSSAEISDLFKGEGFHRLVMAGGGVPRDVLSLFIEALSIVDADNGGKIGKDEIRNLARVNFERKIEELKYDSTEADQDTLIKGIYIIKKFALERQTNIFVVEERMLQQNDNWRALIYRLLDYRIIHSCASALTHKSANGTYHAFAVDIGCYAQYRKLQDRFNEIDVSMSDAKEKMRSAPVLDLDKLNSLAKIIPKNFEEALKSDDEALAA